MIAQFRVIFSCVALMLLIAQTATARDQIKIVGSSTVFPFSAAVAEHLGRSNQYKTPVVESTGTGGGLKLFCAGIGSAYPDFTNASRAIKKSEYEKCKAKNINITEVKIGFDGIVIASSKQAQPIKLTRKQIFQALAARVPVKGQLIKNPYKKWSEVDPALPNIKIEVLGPPPTSGTRDAFVEIAMEGGAKKFPSLAALKKKDKKKFKAIAHALREDGAFIEASENDNLIIQKLVANKNAFGILGFSFLDNNPDHIQGAIVENAKPSFENIASGKYPISRSLYFYVKNNHIGIIPGMKAYIKEFTHRRTSSDQGYLTQKGLIPLPQKERKKMSQQARNLTALRF